MPYINGRLWDTRDRGNNDFQFSNLAQPAATKDEQGKPYTEVYGSKETDGSGWGKKPKARRSKRTRL